jgi:hypothetical protein
VADGVLLPMAFLDLQHTNFTPALLTRMEGVLFSNVSLNPIRIYELSGVRHCDS